RQVLEQELRVTLDRGEQVVEVVRYAARDAADGLELLRLPEVLLAAAQRDLGVAPFGQVAHDEGVADDVALGVDERRYRGARPDARAVLAYAPAVIVVAPGFARDAQRGFEPVGRCRARARLVVIRHRGEQRVRPPAHGFVRAIAGQPLRRRVPAQDHAARVEHDYGVVAHGFGQQPEPLARCLYAGLRPLSGRGVAQEHGYRAGR